MTELRELTLRFVNDALASGNEATFRELVDPNVIAYSGLEPTKAIRGVDAYWTALGKLQALTFVDFDLQDLLTLEDRAIVRFCGRADHTGDQLGVPATNKRIVMWETHLMRWRDGKLVENFVSDINYDWPWLIAPAYPDGVGNTGPES